MQQYTSNPLEVADIRTVTVAGVHSDLVPMKGSTGGTFCRYTSFTTVDADGRDRFHHTQLAGVFADLDGLSEGEPLLCYRMQAHPVGDTAAPVLEAWVVLARGADALDPALAAAYLSDCSGGR